MNFGKAKETPALPPEHADHGEEREGPFSFGFGRGRRGKGRDGGEYEMVRMKEEDENV